MTLLLLCRMVLINPIPTGDLNLYRWEATRCFQMADHILINSPGDSALVLFDPNEGKVIAAYRKTGQGSGDLNLPIVLSVDQGTIRVLNNNRHIVQFDYELKWVQGAEIRLPQDAIALQSYDGVQTDARHIWLVVDFSNPYILHGLTQAEEGYKTSAKWFENHFPEKIMSGRFAGRALFLGPGLISEQDYRVGVFHDVPKNPQAQPDVELYAVIEDIEIKNKYQLTYRCTLERAAVLASGYVLCLETAGFEDPERGKSRKVLDFFAMDGRFVRRMPLGADFLVPNINRPGAWIYRDDEEMLVPCPEP